MQILLSSGVSIGVSKFVTPLRLGLGGSVTPLSLRRERRPWQYVNKTHPSETTSKVLESFAIWHSGTTRNAIDLVLELFARIPSWLLKERAPGIANLHYNTLHKSGVALGQFWVRWPHPVPRAAKVEEPIQANIYILRICFPKNLEKIGKILSKLTKSCQKIAKIDRNFTENDRSSRFYRKNWFCWETKG